MGAGQLSNLLRGTCPEQSFAEDVEHDVATPRVTATELNTMITSDQDIAVLDSRSFEKYHTNSIPTAVSVPGAELVLSR